MTSWMNEAAVQGHNANGFPQMSDPNGGMIDPSAFMANPAAAQFNQAQFNAQQMAVAMQNGQMRNASPSFQNPMYQTNPVIPSKRPRPREDSMAGSPRPNPGMLPTSRAETPQQGQFQNFPQGGMPQQTPGQPSPYPHLQLNGSANATPSPIMGNQMRPGSVPQRVSTTSPHPFSPAAQQFGPQASPIPSEHGGTPQPNPYIQQGNYPQGYQPNFTPTPSPARPSPTPNAMGGQMMPQQMNQMQQQMAAQMGQMGQMPNQMGGQMGFPQGMPQARNAMEQQKMMYQMQLQRQLQQSNMQGQMGAQNMAQQQRNMMARQQMPNGQMPPNANVAAMRAQQGAMGQPQQQQQQPQQPQQPQQGMSRGGNTEAFMKQLTVFMSNKQLPLEINPVVADRPVNLMQLFQAVSKFGGYRNVTASNVWPQISNACGFNPMQFQIAPGHIKGIYERNLLKFEEAWTQNRSKMMQHQQQQQQQQQGMAMGGAQGTPTKQMPPGAMPPGQMMQPGQQPHMPQAQTPVKQMPPGVAQANVNGFSTPQPPHAQQGNAIQGHSRNSLSKSHPTPTTDEFALASPAGKAGTSSVPGSAHPDSRTMVAQGPSVQRPADPTTYEACSRMQEIHYYGGVDIVASSKLADELDKYRPTVPAATELGNIDIHALSRSLQCGIHGEVRLALDTLATITGSPYHQLELELTKCEDLLETIVECAEDQIDILAENNAEESDEISINSYEDVFRAAKLEKLSLRDVPAFGSREYELDRAVERLICITTILRNLSFNIANQNILAEEMVIKCVCVVIRYLGTRRMLLRTHSDTLDFMKDVIIFLTNIGSSVEITGKEQALCLLQFVLAFAPSPVPSMANSDKIFFPAYDPNTHPYLLHAVDVLAKLLARDEPNRTFYKTIFAADASGSPACELLTRTFALAISPVPDQNRDPRPASLPPYVEARKPTIMQGLLAADIVASLAPGYESGVTRAWLASGDGFAQNLFRLIRSLSIQFEGPPPRSGAQPRNQQKKDQDLVYIVVLAVSTLRKLAEKAIDPNAPAGSIPPNAIPSDDTVIGALQMDSLEWTKDGMLAHLIAYASLEG